MDIAQVGSGLALFLIVSPAFTPKPSVVLCPLQCLISDLLGTCVPSSSIWRQFSRRLNFSRKCLFQGHIFSGFSISQTLISAPQRLAANSKLQCLFSVCPSWHRRPSAACRLVAWTTLLLLFSLIAMPLTLYECRSLFAGSTGSSLGQSTDYCLLSTSS